MSGWTRLNLALVLAVTVCALWVVVSHSRARALTVEIYKTKQALSRLETEKSELENLQARILSAGEVQQQARERLGMRAADRGNSDFLQAGPTAVGRP